jgi:hypothetical protein
MTLKEQLRQNVFPNFVNAGIFKNGDRVKFQIRNGNDLEFQCYTKSCGCLGRIIMTPTTVDFDIEAKYEEHNSVVVYLDSHDLYKKRMVGGTEKLFSLNTGALVVGVNPTEELKATKFDKHTQVFFNDGNEFKLIDIDGLLMDNPDKASISIQTVFWVLKD